jgi:Lon protease-like protein
MSKNSLSGEPLESVRHIKFLRICRLPSPVALPFVSDELKVGKVAQTQLLRDTVHTNHKIFGMIYADSAEKCLEDAPEGTIGCSVLLKHVKLAKTGGKIAKIAGAVRFRVVEYFEYDAPYSVAGIEYFRDERVADETDEETAVELATLMKNVFDESAHRSGLPSDLPVIDIPATPLSFLFADIFEFNTETRLRLLNSRSTAERLEICREKILEYEAYNRDKAENREFLKRFSNIYNPNQG